MINLKKYTAVLAVVAAASLSACGGGDSGGGGVVGGGGGAGGGGGSCDTSTVAGVVCYINNLIATATLDTALPTDISGVTLATDDTSVATSNP